MSNLNKHLTLAQRKTIDNLICKNRDSCGGLKISLKDISDIIQKDPSTISKEVKLRRISSPVNVPNYKRRSSYCAWCNLKDSCPKRNLPSDNAKCENFKLTVCKYIKNFPWVCNGCSKKGFCNLNKYYYYPNEAHDEYKDILVGNRQGPTMTKQMFDHIDKIISTGLKKGQSLYHIYCSNNDLSKLISRRTAYNYLKSGLFSVSSIDTPRNIKIVNKDDYKPKKNSIILRELKKGRNYTDYLKYVEENPDELICEMDTVIGKQRESRALLSLKIIKVQFQYFILLENKTKEAVVNALNELQGKIGIELYKKFLGVILTDNGSEFCDISGIITDNNTGEIRTKLFFCQPMQSGQKGSCENGHELLRKILPKGKSFASLTKADMVKINSHLNSYKRASLFGLSPIEAINNLYGDQILKALGVEYIPGNEVLLNKDLIK